MKVFRNFKFSSIVVFAVILFLLSNCSSDKGKVPITTGSKEAKKLFVQGRDLQERLQAVESRTYFEQAVEKDPEFAMANLYLAQVQPTNVGFFQYLEKAKKAAENASEAEKLWIMSVEAGVSGLPMKQKEYLDKLVVLCPRDERVYNLIGTHYFATQEWEKAVEAYNKSVDINPNFSQPYNQLGYAYRFLGKYDNAEKVFRKYIELIPNDPNPYDSYAELLLKMGRYEESIVNYKKALEQNPSFANSFIGIATDLNMLGKYEEARAKLDELLQNARNDGERRFAIFTMAVSYADEGNYVKTLEMFDKNLAIASVNGDATAKSADLANMGNVYLEMGDFEKANVMFKSSLKEVLDSDRSDDIKDNAKRISLFNDGWVAMKQKDFPRAKEQADAFMKEVSAINNPNQIKLGHQLNGMIALAMQDYTTALSELEQSNLQNPYNYYRMALAYMGMGDNEKMIECAKKAADFNGLANLQLSFIRTKAKAMMAMM